jgi:hypothetical protein
MKLLGFNNVGFDVTDQLLITSSAFVRILEKNWEFNEILFCHFGTELPIVTLHLWEIAIYITKFHFMNSLEECEYF